jgi:hypothetical protein
MLQIFICEVLDLSCHASLRVETVLAQTILATLEECCLEGAFEMCCDLGNSAISFILIIMALCTLIASFFFKEMFWGIIRASLIVDGNFLTLLFSFAQLFTIAVSPFPGVVTYFLVNFLVETLVLLGPEFRTNPLLEALAIACSRVLLFSVTSLSFLPLLARLSSTGIL